MRECQHTPPTARPSILIQVLGADHEGIIKAVRVSTRRPAEGSHKEGGFVEDFVLLLLREAALRLVCLYGVGIEGRARPRVIVGSLV